MKSIYRTFEKSQNIAKASAAPSADYISTLPTEIIEIIMQYIPDAVSKLCFALTSKRTLDILTHDDPPDLGEDRDMFLHLLSIDSPHLSVCSCKKLHTHSLFDRTCRRPHLLICSQPLGLEWKHLYLAMKRHRLGPDYGIPLFALEGYLKPDMFDNERISAKIIDGELYIYTITRHKHLDGLAFGKRTCPHTTFRLLIERAESYVEFIKRESSVTVEGEIPISSIRSYRTGLYSCGSCTSAFSLKWKRRPVVGTSSVTVETYHNYGRGEHPDDIMWVQHCDGAALRARYEVWGGSDMIDKVWKRAK